MAVLDDLNSDINTICVSPWNLRDGQKVPTTETVALSGGAVELEATFLYADLANSSKMSEEYDRRVAAKVMKSFLATSCRLIKSCQGQIVSFDGDRVMGIFLGGQKNTNAADCSLKINYVVTKLLQTKFESQYSSVRNASFKIKHGVGIDTGTIIGVRAGARGANDLVWVGRPANLAAKLSDL